MLGKSDQKSSNHWNKLRGVFQTWEKQKPPLTPYIVIHSFI